MKDILIGYIGKIRISFAWYDIWIGLFIDAGKGKIYVCPLPCLLLTYSYKKPTKEEIELGEIMKKVHDPSEIF